jgi:glycosyltransferase involved in cell wall biosynthesis
MPGESSRALEIITRNLDTETYHRWLSMADVGLFLYEPARYVARCSGVLLEMLARGIPVIVPDDCWLAHQVRMAGGHRSIGFIYQDRAEIPDLMRQFAKRREEIQSRAKAYAATIAERHNGRNTLLSMGIESAGQRQRAA